KPSDEPGSSTRRVAWGFRAGCSPGPEPCYSAAIMRYRSLFGFGAVLALPALAALAACGGSSSETPPPLQPDPAGFRYASGSPARVAEASDASDGGDAPRTL